MCPWYLNRLCFSIVKAVITLLWRSDIERCSDRSEETVPKCVLKRWTETTYYLLPVIASVSAAVPAPQQYMFGARKWIFAQFLSATVSPFVDRVSAPRTTPEEKTTPQIVVPVFFIVLVCLGGSLNSPCSIWKPLLRKSDDICTRVVFRTLWSTPMFTLQLVSRSLNCIIEITFAKMDVTCNIIQSYIHVREKT